MMLEGHFQNAYVTRDLERSIELFKDAYGVDNFIHFEPDMEVMTPEGPRRSISRAALGWVDSRFLIELIEPISGSVDIYSDFLPEDGHPRFHHAAMRTHDWDDTRARLVAKGWRIAMEHHMPEGLKFIYVDARQNLGHYLEYIWATPEMWKYMGGR